MRIFNSIAGTAAITATVISMATHPVLAQAKNPILWADVPDDSVLRVGNTYYMSSTTMHMNPGLPIMRSDDLVNWQLVSYAYPTLGDSDALALRNGKSDYGRGSWASSLRFHNGLYYVSTFSNTTNKTYIFSTPSIEKGPWKQVSFSPHLHDSSLFFDDDGRIYMANGGGSIRLTELNADLTGPKQDGFNQVIIKDASRVAGPNVGLPAEGSQLFKVNGKYYLFCITWPKGGMRTELVFRADKITGPYEGQVAMSDRGIAQGGIVDTPDGRWFAVLFRDSGAVGRIPYLMPVTWKDGWPILGVNGKVPDTLDLPAPAPGLPKIVASDEFDRSPGEPALPLVWQWNHNPDNDHWSLTQRPGFLRLTTGTVCKGLLSAPNSLTQRTVGPTCSGEISVDVSHLHDGDVAGLAAFQKNFGYVAVEQTDGHRSIVMVNAGSGSPIKVAEVPLKQETVSFKIDMDFQNRADRAKFYYSLNGHDWTPIGDVLKMTYTLPHFMGYRFALFNYATQSTGGWADFDYFRIREHIEPIASH